MSSQKLWDSKGSGVAPAQAERAAPRAARTGEGPHVRMLSPNKPMEGGFMAIWLGLWLDLWTSFLGNKPDFSLDPHFVELFADFNSKQGGRECVHPRKGACPWDVCLGNEGPWFGDFTHFGGAFSFSTTGYA